MTFWPTAATMQRFVTGARNNYLMKAFGSFAFTQVISAAVNFLIVVVFTRFVVPSEFGRITIIWMFVLVASMIIDGRLNTAFSIKFYKSSREDNIKNMYTIFVYNAAVFIVCYAATLLFPSLIEKALQTHITKAEIHLTYLIILFMLIYNFYTNLLVISQKPKEYLYANIGFSTILAVSTVIFLVVLKWGYISYLYAYMVAYFCMSLMAVRYFILNYRPSTTRLASLSELKELLKISIPLIPTGLSLLALSWANRYLLNVYVGLAVVGTFSVGYRFSEFVDRFISNPLGQAIGPMLYKKYAEDLESYKKIIGTVFKYYWITMSVIIMIYLLFLKELFALVIDKKYIQGYYIVPIILISIAVWGANGVVNNTIVLKEKTRNVFLFTVTTVVVNILLNITLIPHWGIYGAASATLISYILQYLMMAWYAQKLLYVAYDHGVMLKLLCLLAVFVAVLFGIGTVKLNLVASLLIETVMAALFVVFIYKAFELKKGMIKMLSYAGVS